MTQSPATLPSAPVPPVPEDASAPADPAPKPARANDPLAIRLEREIRAGRIALPVLPTVALEVQTLIEKDAPISALVRAIEREPAVAAGLIKYANAAVYTGLRDVTEIEQALLRLGLNSVREAVVSLSAAAAFQPNEIAHRGFYQTLWLHSMTTAVTARRLASFTAVPKETAFLAGLLHDIGKIIVFRGIHTLRRRDPEGFNVPDHTIGEFVDALHCRVGQVLCEAWNVPKALTNAIARHHDTTIDPHEVLTAIVQIADLIAAKIGASFKPDPNTKLIDRPAFSILQLDDVKVTGMLIDVEDQRDSMLQVF